MNYFTKIRRISPFLRNISYLKTEPISKIWGNDSIKIINKTDFKKKFVILGLLGGGILLGGSNLLCKVKREQNSIEDRIYSIQFAANKPNEDTLSTYQIKKEDKNYGYYASVFDGHGGWQLSEYVKKNLHLFFQEELDITKEIPIALENAYNKAEKTFLDAARLCYSFGFANSAYVGACALTAIVQDNKIYTACAGDCKSFIFKKEGNEYKAIKSNKPFNANKKSEQKRLKNIFKDEDDVINCVKEKACYVKGALMATRTIGDFRLKYSEFNIREHGSEYGFRRPINKFTGPYVNPKPDIKSFEINENDHFMILGTDGLWDEISLAEVCKIVQEFSDKPESIPHKLLDKAIGNAAEKAKIPKEILMNIEFPGDRRQIHDDIAIIVLDLRDQI